MTGAASAWLRGDPAAAGWLPPARWSAALGWARRGGAGLLRGAGAGAGAGRGAARGDLGRARSPTPRRCRSSPPEDEIEEQARAALERAADDARGALGADGRPRRAGEAARALARAGHPDGEPAAAAADRGGDRPRRARRRGAWSRGSRPRRRARSSTTMPPGGCRWSPPPSGCGSSRSAASGSWRWRLAALARLAAQAAVAANGRGDPHAAAGRRARRLHRRGLHPAAGAARRRSAARSGTAAGDAAARRCCRGRASRGSSWSGSASAGWHWLLPLAGPAGGGGGRLAGDRGRGAARAPALELREARCCSSARWSSTRCSISTDGGDGHPRGAAGALVGRRRLCGLPRPIAGWSSSACG